MNRDSERIFDEYLVAAAATGDRQALARLVARWQPRLLRHAWRVLGDAERARDMVQEAWVDILRGLGRLDDVAAFPAWAYRIVTRRCQRQFQRAAREPFEPEEAGDADPTPTPEHRSAEFGAEVAIVMDAIATLPAPQRAALALFYIGDLGVAEIAIALDVPPGTVKTRLMHARRKVRAHLEGKSNGQD
ncbi:MAG: RNA polymerase sigma factor [Pseudomonadota bacterium]|nr:RNA polymerase sigma factor [Pseudomonadota bacterium]